MTERALELIGYASDDSDVIDGSSSSDSDVGDDPDTPASESSGKFSDICGNKSDTGK